MPLSRAPRARQFVARAAVEPSITLPDAEFQRLMELLDDSPHPAGLVPGETMRRRARDITRGREPFVQGPRNVTLVWSPSAAEAPKMLCPRYGHGTPADTYLALGPFVYHRTIGADRELVWRQLQTPRGSDVVRLSLFDTRALSPVGTRRTALFWYPVGDMVSWKSGLLGEVDVSLAGASETRPLAFPSEFRIVDEVLMLGFQPRRRTAPRRPVVLAAHPEAGEVEVLSLDWWTRKHWSIARVARDPASRNLVADGFGIKPFLMGPSGAFLGWLRPAKPRGRGTPPLKVSA